MYIGQDVKRTMNAADINPNFTQLNRKMQLSRYLDNISGISSRATPDKKNTSFLP